LGLWLSPDPPNPLEKGEPEFLEKNAKSPQISKSPFTRGI
jgi:hypothetical protein